MRAITSDCTTPPATDEPACTRTVTVDASPTATPATPANVGVESVELTGGAFNDTTGATVSDPVTVNVRATLNPTFPAASDCSARTV